MNPAGLADGLTDGLADGIPVGLALGVELGLGPMEGVAVAEAVGLALGATDWQAAVRTARTIAANAWAAERRTRAVEIIVGVDSHLP